jgi:hypothetical protein
VPGWRGGSQSSATADLFNELFHQRQLALLPSVRVRATVAADENALSQKLGMCTAYSVGDKERKGTSHLFFATRVAAKG